MKRRPVEQKLTTVTKVFEYSCTTLYYVIRLVTLSEILFTNFGCWFSSSVKVRRRCR